VAPEMEGLIFHGAPGGEIEEAAVRSGTSLLFKQGGKKVVRQITTIYPIFLV